MLAEECTEHVYDYDCDHKCNVCGEYRAVEHSFDTVCTDAKYSWKVCECGKTWDYQKHYYTNANDTICYWCGYKRELKHKFETQMSDELYHWEQCDCGEETEKELHVYSGDDCERCGHKKPTWYNESAHLTKDGKVYLSIEEAAAYLKDHLVQRNIGMEVCYYFEKEIELLIGEEQTALFEEICKYTGRATEGDILWDNWEGSYYYDDIYDDKIHYIALTGWFPDYASTAEQERWLTEEIDRIFEELQIETMTEYEKVCAIYKYICDNVSYAHEISDPAWNDSHTQEVANAYWALKTGYAICDGYADLVYRMMLQAGVNARIVSGTVGYHAWNIVEVDGVYYCVDATNDATTTDYPYFLCGLAEFRELGAIHWEDPEYHTKEFFAEYPVSFTSYGKVLPKSGDVAASGVNNEGTNWSLTSDGILTISGSGKIGNPSWKEWKGFVKKIVIEEGITEISMEAFAYCPGLEEVLIPESVTVIADKAFTYCDSLQKVSLPEGLTYIGNSAFEGCGSLEEVILPDSVEYLGEGAFRMCYGLEKVVLSPKMKKIARETFWRSENLLTVIIPEGIEEIGDRAFLECTGLEEIVLPDTLKKLGQSVFQHAFTYKKKVSLTVSKGITEIGDMCFEKCNIAELIWLAPIETITEEMFAQCRYMERLVLGDSITKIEFRAFAYCISLETIVLPTSLKEIERAAFLCCNSLTELTIPAGVEVLGDWAFGECEALKKVIFEGNPPKVDGGAPFTFKGEAYYRENGAWTGTDKSNLVSGENVTWIVMHAEGEAHTKQNVWYADEFGHWKPCGVCNEKLDREDHVFDSEADMSCNICDYCKVAKGVHFYNLQKFDEINHWNECACGEKDSIETHQWDGGIQKGNNIEYTCSVCRIIKSEVIPATPTPTVMPTTKPAVTQTPIPTAANPEPTETPTVAPTDSEVVTGDNTGSSGNNMMVVIAAVAAVAVIGGGVGIGFAVKKKRG